MEVVIKMNIDAKTTTVNAIECPNCGDVIYSRARHDYRNCSCGEIAIDGGFDYTKVCYKDENSRPKNVVVEISASKKELFDDWNNRKDKFGIIKSISYDEHVGFGPEPDPGRDYDGENVFGPD